MNNASREIAPAKLNLALHVRGRRRDGRHRIETLFAFCIDGDGLCAELSQDVSLNITGPFADALGSANDNLVLRAARLLRQRASVSAGASLTLDKRLPVASGIGGGSADAAAALRLLGSLWRIEPQILESVAPELGSDVPACLLSLPSRGEGAGDQLTVLALPELAGTPVLLLNPCFALSTAAVFSAWDGVDRGPLEDWRTGRNDLEQPAIALVPEIETMLAWLGKRAGANFVRMSGSGATCFALFDSEEARDAAALGVPSEWWHLSTYLR